MTDTKKQAIAMPDPETSAFRARRAADRAGDLADQVVDMCVQFGHIEPELVEALVAARLARKEAKIAELVAEGVSQNVRTNPFELARRSHSNALHFEQAADLALRKLRDKLPELMQKPRTWDPYKPEADGDDGRD